MFESSPSSPLFGMSSTPSTLFLWTLSNMRYDLQIMPLFVSVEWTCACMCVCVWVFQLCSPEVQMKLLSSGETCLLHYQRGTFYFHNLTLRLLSFMRSLHVGVCLSVHVFTACVLWLGPNKVLYVYYLIITCVCMHVCVLLKLNEKECNTYVLVFSTIRKSILLRILIKDTKIHA